MSKLEYTITVYTENQIGLLKRIAIFFSKKNKCYKLKYILLIMKIVHQVTIVIHETKEFQKTLQANRKTS